VASHTATRIGTPKPLTYPYASKPRPTIPSTLSSCWYRAPAKIVTYQAPKQLFNHTNDTFDGKCTSPCRNAASILSYSFPGKRWGKHCAIISYALLAVNNSSFPRHEAISALAVATALVPNVLAHHQFLSESLSPAQQGGSLW
jgi:hypothetical protein